MKYNRILNTAKLTAGSIALLYDFDIDKIDELLAKFGGERNTWKKMSGKDSQGNEWHWYTRGDGTKVGWKIKGVHLHDPF